MPIVRRLTVLLLLLLAVPATLTGCASGALPAPQPHGPRVLRVAYVDQDFELDPAPPWFAEAVETASHGSLRLTFATDCCGRGADRQDRLLHGVAARRWDLGIAGPRDLADAGASAMGALTAPRLVDSYAAEAAVLRSDVPAVVLPSATNAGVRGLAVLPGLLRRPIANKRALQAPADWKGISFWTLPSTTSAAAIRALGATPTSVGLDERDDGLESGTISATENAVIWQVQTEHVPQPVFTLNEALWPRFGVVVANRSVRFSSRERAWLAEAAAKVAERTAEIASMDARAVSDACGMGARFATASADQLEATDRAIAPVVSEMEQEPSARTAIEQIRALKPKALPVEYDVPKDCVSD